MLSHSFLKVPTNKQCTIAPFRCFLWRYVCFRHVQLILKCATWKEPQGWNTCTVEELEEDGDTIQVSVSNLYVTFCGAAAKLRDRVTVCWGSWTTHSYTQTGVFILLIKYICVFACHHEEEIDFKYKTKYNSWVHF